MGNIRKQGEPVFVPLPCFWISFWILHRKFYDYRTVASDSYFFMVVGT